MANWHPKPAPIELDNHHARHENGGADEVEVTGLSGLLADDQHVLDAEVTAVAIAKTTVDAQSVLGGISDDTPIAITLAEQTILGRKTGGNVAALSGADTLLAMGISATLAELNYVDGVTSAIQTQLDLKAPLASPTFTGTMTLGGDMSTDRWLSSDTNTFLGVGVAGAGNLQHVAGSTGYNNAGFGYRALYSLTTGYNNMAFGFQALFNTTTGYQNMAIGSGALQSTIGGQRNVAIGTNALFTSEAGQQNTAIGFSALFLNTTNYNTAIGYNALYNVSSGWGNTGLGYQAGDNITSGDANIIIGYNADAPSATADYQINIGNLIIGKLPYANDNYAAIQAWDTGNAAVEVARAAGAADPYFSMGASQEFKFTTAGLAGFFSATPVAQQTGCAVPTYLNTCIAAITALRTALNNLGLTTVV